MHIQVSVILDVSARVSFTQLEEQIQEAGREGMRRAMKESIRSWEQQQRHCPRCGQEDLRVEGTVSRTLLLLFGRVHVGIRRYRCQACLHRWCPARALLSGLQQRRISAPLREAAVLAGASWSYRHAAAHLQHLCGAQISAEEVRLLTMQQGAQQAYEQQQQAEEQLGQKESVLPLEAGVIGMDGGWVPSREQRGGMEGKVAVVAQHKEVRAAQVLPSPASLSWVQLSKRIRQGRRLVTAPARARWSRRHYVATFAGSSHLGQQVHAAAKQMGLDPAQSVVVADGAQWIKQETQRHFPAARTILDWPHLWRTMAKAVRAVALAREASPKWQKSAFERLGTCLWKGQVEQAETLLLRWQEEQKGRPPVKALSDAITYLHTQREWIGNYAQCKRQGDPVGSGIIERAVSLVINRRMKKRGMRWKRANATAMVALRVGFLNADWQRQAHLRAFP